MFGVLQAALMKPIAAALLTAGCDMEPLIQES
jgi:hypothetical protein